MYAATTRATRQQAEPLSALNQAGGLLLALGISGTLALARWLHTGRRRWLVPLLGSSLTSAALFYIFRNPQRATPDCPQAVLAAADGLILQVSRQDESPFLHLPTTRLTIGISPRHVQVVRAPVAGTVMWRRYEPGQTRSGQPDDHNWLGIETCNGTRLLISQVASPLWRRIPSFLARRIICWPDVTDQVVPGQLIGHLPLGGQVEVYLPGEARIVVTSGQKVLAGQTVIAWLDREEQGALGPET